MSIKILGLGGKSEECIRKIPGMPIKNPWDLLDSGGAEECSRKISCRSWPEAGWVARNAIQNKMAGAGQRQADAKGIGARSASRGFLGALL